MAINININSQNVVQTTAEWATDTTIYPDKYVLWVSDDFYPGTDQMKFSKAKISCLLALVVLNQ